MTTYLNPTGTQSSIWSAHDRCHICGGIQTRNGACRCRYCDSCSEYWLADTFADGDDGRPKNETCPDCVAIEQAESEAA